MISIIPRKHKSALLYLFGALRSQTPNRRVPSVYTATFQVHITFYILHNSSPISFVMFNYILYDNPGLIPPYLAFFIQ